MDIGTEAWGSALSELIDQPHQQRAEKRACKINPNIAEISAASGNEKLQRLVAHCGEQAQPEGFEQREVLRVAKGSRQKYAEDKKFGKMPQLAQKMVRHPRKNRLNDREKAETLRVARCGGHRRMPENDNQPRAGEQQPNMKSSFFHKILHKRKRICYNGRKYHRNL